MRTFVAAGWPEVGWWASRLTMLIRRFPGHAVVLVACLWLLSAFLPVTSLAGGLAAGTVGLRWWALARPYGFHRLIGGPLARLSRRRWYRRHWSEMAEACGLVRYPQPPMKTGSTPTAPAELRAQVPKLLRVSADGPRIRLRLRPLMGQTVDDVEKAGEQLRMAAGASRVRVEPHGINEVQVTFTMGDALAEPFTADRPSRETSPVTDRVVMGRVEDGGSWSLPVGPHTLVAGSSGAGKGSVFWSFAFGLAPAVHAGLVRLHGIDLKGGMEVLMGKELFSTCATDATEAVVLLETQVRTMQERTRAYAGKVRAHTPTVDEPLHVVMIDELAALTAYCPERDLQRRAEMAINLLCSQGRAPGFVVFACLQDPRKEVIPSRGLFTQMIGLRLKDVNETAMVLGETAVTSGAHCHRIARTMPGMGYVVPEEGGYPVRVRAGFASDHAIRSIAATFATPVQEELPVIETPTTDDLRAARRRATRGSEVA
jgi:S-DNA-T family DNA segregation ATPase FtsK/SpoIIIE